MVKIRLQNEGIPGVPKRYRGAFHAYQAIYQLEG